jgi:hypothetical protein
VVAAGDQPLRCLSLGTPPIAIFADIVELPPPEIFAQIAGLREVGDLLRRQALLFAIIRHYFDFAPQYFRLFY